LETLASQGTPAELRERLFFLVMAIAIAVTVIVAFSLFRFAGISSFGAPWWVHIHAVTFMTWIGFYVLHRLSRIQEGEEHSERVVVQQFVLEAFRSIDQLSPIDGLRTVILFPFGRLRDRRLKPRP
jgi:small-conductance mechanosensitive channel